MRIGVLGAAKIADRSTVPAMLATEGVEVVAVAARSRERAREFAERHGIAVADGYSAIVEDPAIDAVYVPLPTALHEEWSLEALRNGKHVLCEKSLTGGLESSLRVLDEARRRDLAVFENFMCETHPQSLWVRRALADGEIGTVQYASLAFGFPAFPADDQRNSRALDGGALNDAGAYCLDMAVFYLGAVPERITMELFQGDAEVDQRGSGMIGFADGLTAHVAFGFGYDYRNEARIWGSQGQIDIDRAFSIPAERTPYVSIVRNTGRTAVDLPAADQFRSQAYRFRDTVSDPAARRSELDRRAAHAYLMQAARDSAASGRTVELSGMPGWDELAERLGRS